MSSQTIEHGLDLDRAGTDMYSLIAELYPICRSITGNGFRETLRRLQRFIPIECHEVPSGTQVFDWTVPREWNITDAYVKNAAGSRVIDFQQSNLHVVSYSMPVRATLPLSELKRHLYTLPDQPDWIPYRTSYYHDSWGFCLSHNQLLSLEDGDYEVCIDSHVQDGSLTYGEYYLKGETPEEVLISCHACHPSLCNDNLSGIAVSVELARRVSRMDRRYSYRFLFIPGTIGAITWLYFHEPHTALIRHGLVLTGVGDAGPQTYKRSRRGNTEIDSAMAHVLGHAQEPHTIVDFSPYGYDERQYCSPGFDLPVGCFMRTPHGQYPEYHTSADNLDFVRPASLAGSLEICLKVLSILEQNKTYLNRNPKCEPQLGKRGLYRSMGGQTADAVDETALLWVLNLSDGQHDLLGIADRAGLPFETIGRAARALVDCGLLAEPLDMAIDVPTGTLAERVRA